MRDRKGTARMGARKVGLIIKAIAPLWMAWLVPYLVLQNNACADQVDDYLVVFDSACILKIPSAARVQQMAKALKWKDVPKDIAASGAPTEGQLIGSWMVQEGQAHIIISVSQGTIDGKEITSCSAVTELPDPDLIIDRLRHMYNVKSILDETEGYQRYRTFKLSVSEQDMLLTVLTGTHTSTMEIANLIVQYPMPRQ